METIRLEEDTRGVATLTLARGGKRNAMSGEMIADLTEAAHGIAASETIRVVILAAEGPAFCAGGDLNWMRAQMAADDAAREREARALADMLHALDTLPVPLIGRIHGDAFGGGVGLMSVCDAVFAAEGARFGLTETRLGLIPATIGPYVVARMGAAKARWVFFSSRIFDVVEAEALGIVSKIVPADALDAAIAAEVASYLACAPGAVREAKALIKALGGGVSDAARDASIAALVTRWQSDEAEEGTRAFFEKRPPRWAR